MSLFDRLSRLYRRLTRRVQESVKVIDDEYWRDLGRRTEDRPAHTRERELDDLLEAWRFNPLCRRIVGLTTDYVLGDGLTVSSKLLTVDRFVASFWSHPQNRLGARLPVWCDELTRTGELFVVLSRNPADGMSYTRLVPAVWIDEVETDPDDLEREVNYHQRGFEPGDPGRWWPAAAVAPPDVDQVMLHFAINRPAGAVRGESDLLAILAWLKHYAGWLEDRVRVNRLKSAFVWQVTLTGATPADIAAKKAAYGRAPTPGSVIISNENERWEAVQPKIDAESVEADGKAIRLMAAAGAGVPLHFLSEGESATRATAAEMGDPTFRRFRRRQREMCDIVLAVISAAYERAVLAGRARRVNDLQLRIDAPEIVQADNEGLGRALRMTAEALKTMHEHGWVDNETAAGMAFKAAGEVFSSERISEILARAAGELAASRREVVEDGRDPVS